MPRIENIAEFSTTHRDIKARIATYLEMNKSNYVRLDPHTKAQLNRSQERFFHANNFESRIRFVGMVFEHLSAYIDGADSPIELHFVTLIPDDFAVPEAKAPDFDVTTLQEWVGSVLGGFDYVGMVEAALFPNWPHGQPTISWHVHVIVFGAMRHRLDRLLAQVREEHRSLVDGVGAGYAEDLHLSQLEEKVCYVSKSPLTAYRPNPHTMPLVDLTTEEVTRMKTGRWKISKPPLRTGEHVRMCRVMANQQLDRLLFGGGAGAAVVSEIRRRIFPEDWNE